MGYYHIQLSKNVSNLCTIIPPWRKYFYKRLTIGVANSPDIFQQKINASFHIFKFIHTYIDNILILTKGYWTDHVEKVKLTLHKLKGNGLKCNIEKLFFLHTKIEYLGFWVTHNDDKPTNRKIEAIPNMKPHNPLK